MLFGLAMGQGTQILIGHMVDAGNFEGAYRQLLKSLKSSVYITMALAIVITIFSKSLLGIFTEDTEIIYMGSTLLMLCLVLEPGRTFNLVVISSLRATGDATISVKAGVISMWGIGVPLAYLLGIKLGFGLPGIWIDFIVDEWFRGISMYYRWKSRAWEKKVLVQSEAKTA